jgi:hypothetical protein
MKMKKMKKIILSGLIVITSLAFNSCNPFDDFYLTLSLDKEFDVQGFGSEINIGEGFCLSDFDDYNDNKNELDEIRYISSAYFTINATTGLQGDSLIVTLYQADRTTILFQFVQLNFVASAQNNPLEIVITPQEVNNVNSYLKNIQEDKCFWATLQVSNVQSASQFYSLISRVEFLTELKIKP